MEVSSGEEYYIASDNTGTPLAVFSSNGQMIKQVSSCESHLFHIYSLHHLHCCLYLTDLLLLLRSSTPPTARCIWTLTQSSNWWWVSTAACTTP